MNIAAVSRALETTYAELLRAIERPMPPAIATSYATAVRSVKAALDFAQGSEVGELRGLLGRAHGVRVDRPEYPERLRQARAGFHARLQELVTQAAADLAKAQEAAAAAERAPVPRPPATSTAKAKASKAKAKASRPTSARSSA